MLKDLVILHQFLWKATLSSNVIQQHKMLAVCVLINGKSSYFSDSFAPECSGWWQQSHHCDKGREFSLPVMERTLAE